MSPLSFVVLWCTHMFVEQIAATLSTVGTMAEVGITARRPDGSRTMHDTCTCMVCSAVGPLCAHVRVTESAWPAGYAEYLYMHRKLIKPGLGRPAWRWGAGVRPLPHPGRRGRAAVVPRSYRGRTAVVPWPYPGRTRLRGGRTVAVPRSYRGRTPAVLLGGRKLTLPPPPARQRREGVL